MVGCNHGTEFIPFHDISSPFLQGTDIMTLAHRTRRLSAIVVSLPLLAIAACQQQPGSSAPARYTDADSNLAVPAQEDTAQMKIEKTSFGKTADGVEVDLYTCTNAKGSVLKMTNFGATTVALEVPDRDGNRANVTMGFETLDGYLGQHPYFGATVGRYCNRIGKGRFTLEGQEYTLATNNGRTICTAAMSDSTRSSGTPSRWRPIRPSA
jgi:hypothetical protein